MIKQNHFHSLLEQSYRTNSDRLFNASPKEKKPLIYPGQTIGVLGGGQLGRMMILEGRKLGYRFITLDPAVDCPGSQVADEHIVGQYDNPMAIQRLHEKVDLVVYEFENIQPDMVRLLETMKPVPQGSKLLEITRHRAKERKALEDAGVPVADYRFAQSKQELQKALQEIGFPCVVKTCTGGYDGKGQWVFHNTSDWVNHSSEIPEQVIEEGVIIEKFIPFIKELSVVVARSWTGEIKVFPTVMNIHRNHILHMTVAPAPIDEMNDLKAQQIAVRVAEHLQVVGILAVEMFLLDDGTILVNELAPRPHNSGHVTMDACKTSQFEQFLRAVVGLPLHSTQYRQPAVMVNLLGEHQELFFDCMQHLPINAKIHWYGKEIAKQGRKMGHINILADSNEEAIQIAEEIKIWEPLTAKEWAAIQATCR